MLEEAWRSERGECNHKRKRREWGEERTTSQGCLLLLEAENGKETELPWKPPERIQPLNIRIGDFGIPEQQEDKDVGERASLGDSLFWQTQWRNTEVFWCLGQALWRDWGGSLRTGPVWILTEYGLWVKIASLRIPSKEAGHSGECQEAATYSRTTGPSLFPHQGCSSLLMETFLAKT